MSKDLKDDKSIDKIDLEDIDEMLIDDSDISDSKEDKKSYKPDKEKIKEEKDRERYKIFKRNKDKKIKQGFTKSVNAAIDGILYTFRSERNMKLHYLACLRSFLQQYLSSLLLQPGL